MIYSKQLFLALLIVFSALSLAETRPLVKNDAEFYRPLSGDEIRNLPLVQNLWVLRSLLGRPLYPGTIVTLEFPNPGLEQEQGLYGLFKYNQYYDGVIILRKGNHFTLRGCCQNQGNGAPKGTPEFDYIISLYSITRYNITGETLTFFDGQDKTLSQFRKLPNSHTKPENIYNTTWRLVSATGMDYDNLTEFILHFDADKRQTEYRNIDVDMWRSTKYEPLIKGSTPCQNYSYQGRYNTTKNILVVSNRGENVLAVSELEPITSKTEGKEQQVKNMEHTSFFGFFCSTKDISAIKLYLDLLRNTWRYEVFGTLLELYSGQDKKLVFNLINP